MSDRSYTRAEERALEKALFGESASRDDPGVPPAPDCPRCGARMERREVPPRSDVSYVRDRVWLSCPGCARSAVFDRPRPGT